MLIDLVTPEYKAIQKFYGDKRAHRSGLPLMNHINEALQILDWVNAPEITKSAFCLHPIFQADSDFAENWNSNLKEINPNSIILALEYRSVANEYLSYRKISSIQEIRLSPVNEVNLMLAADKIQNRKDFELYHEGTHDRSVELKEYFLNWLDRLGITEEFYLDCKNKLLTHLTQGGCQRSRVGGMVDT